MNLPLALVLAMLSLSLRIAGCGNDRVAELEAQLEVVRSRLGDAEGEVEVLKAAVDDLTSAVEEFDYMDWRIVVPHVRAAASDIESAAGEVETTVDDAVSASR